MAHFDTSRPMADGRHTTRPAGFFGQMVGMVSSWNEARQTRVMLHKLSDRELDDLGLSRGDIEQIR